MKVGLGFVELEVACIKLNFGFSGEVLIIKRIIKMERSGSTASLRDVEEEHGLKNEFIFDCIACCYCEKTT